MGRRGICIAMFSKMCSWLYSVLHVPLLRYLWVLYNCSVRQFSCLGTLSGSSFWIEHFYTEKVQEWNLKLGILVLPAILIINLLNSIFSKETVSPGQWGCYNATILFLEGYNYWKEICLFKTAATHLSCALLVLHTTVSFYMVPENTIDVYLNLFLF